MGGVVVPGIKRGPGRPRKQVAVGDAPLAVLSGDRLARYAEVGGLLEFARFLFPTYKWVDRIHGPVAAVYERHLIHVLKHRGSRGGSESHRITLTLMPRFSLKTTLLVIVYCVWATTIEPNLRIVIGSRREDLAKASLGSIKRIFEGAGPYSKRYGRRKPESKDVDLRLAWGASGIIVGDRTEHELKERTIEVVGVRSMDPGYHYDIGLWDDPHGDDTAEEIDLTWNAMQNFIPILDPWGVMAVTMTVWADNDVPDRMMREWKTQLSEPVICQPAVDPTFSQTFMPELYSLKQLQDARITMGSYKATCQFALERIASDERKFPQSLYREESHKATETQWMYLTLDPAFSNDGSGSEHAITVCGWLPAGWIHVFDAESGVWSEGELLDRLMMHIRKWRPQKVGIEKVAVEQWIKLGLNERLRKLDTARGERIPGIYPLHHGGQSKIERIRWLVDPYRTQQLTFDPDITHKEKLQKQLWSFPRGERMDLLDALAYQFTLTEGRTPTDRSRVPNLLDESITMRKWYESVIKGRPEEFFGQPKGDWRRC